MTNRISHSRFYLTGISPKTLKRPLFSQRKKGRRPPYVSVHSFMLQLRLRLVALCTFLLAAFWFVKYDRNLARTTDLFIVPWRRSSQTYTFNQGSGVTKETITANNIYSTMIVKQLSPAQLRDVLQHPPSPAAPHKREAPQKSVKHGAKTGRSSSTKPRLRGAHQ